MGSKIPLISKSILLLQLFLLFVFPNPVKARDILRSSPRGLFVSVIQDPPVLSSRSEIEKLIEIAQRDGIQTLFVQIYYANRTWFPSTIGDSAPYEAALRNVGEDSFALLIRSAHAAGIEVHAWLNLLSLNRNSNARLLKKYGSEILTRDLNAKKRIEDYLIDNQYFLEPGDPNVRNELAALVEEVLHAYPDLDGIQFDYIRYPDVHPVYGRTPVNIERFRKSTGLASPEENGTAWDDWRRTQVTELLELLVQRTRAIHPDIQISTTGCMPHARAYYEAFQDWPSWIDRGLVDFVTIMNYSPDPATFKQWNVDAKTKTRDFTKVNIGVGAYKLGTSPGIFAKEFEICEKIGGRACVVFHYGSILENPALQTSLAPPSNAA